MSPIELSWTAKNLDWKKWDEYSWNGKFGKIKANALTKAKHMKKQVNSEWNSVFDFILMFYNFVGLNRALWSIWGHQIRQPPIIGKFIQTLRVSLFDLSLKIMPLQVQKSHYDNIKWPFSEHHQVQKSHCDHIKWSVQFELETGPRAA